MTRSEHYRFFVAMFRLAIAACAGMLVITTVAAPAAQAQTYSVIHYFSGGLDGENPIAGVTVAGPGKLVGTTWWARFGL